MHEAANNPVPTSSRVTSFTALRLLLPALALLPLAPDSRAKDAVFNCYEPVPGGFHILLEEKTTARLDAAAVMGVVPPGASPRLHRRPLYPPADRSIVFTPEELTKLPRVNFRPLVLAYHERNASVMPGFSGTQEESQRQRSL